MQEDDPFAIFETAPKRPSSTPLDNSQESIKKKVQKDPMSILQNSLFAKEELALESEDEHQEKKL